VGPERTDALVGNLPPGNHFQYSAVLRRSTRESIFNSVITGHPWGMSIRDANTISGATSGLLQVRNLSLTASDLPSGSASVHDEVRWAGVTSWFNTSGWADMTSTIRNPSSVGLTDMSDLNHPNPVPMLGSELDGTADFTNPALAGFEVVTYRGAFEPGVPMDQQWTSCWTNFDPQNTNYEGTVVAGINETPTKPSLLSQNYPNPFNPSTTIHYTVPEKGFVSLKVYNVAGEEVASLVEGNSPAGSFTANFDAKNLSSGVYFYRLTGNGFTETRKMVLMK
jgi:hypothetical protein